jgi:UDP-glucose 4-epimerase
VGIDDLSAGTRENLVGAPGVSLVVGDIRDAQLVRRLAAGCAVVFHLAAVRSVVRSLDEPTLATSVNVVGSLNVLEAARATGARVVLASSSSVYGDQERFPLRESAEPRPRSPYAASKLAMEIYAAAWWRAYGTPTVSLRYFNVFGPRMNPTGPYALVVPIFIRAMLDGRRPVIQGDGKQARDFTYIDDVVEANLLAANAAEDASGRVFNVGGGRTPTSIRELVRLIGDIVGVEPNPSFEPARAGDVRRTEADLRAAREVLGYRPAVAIDVGLARTVAWFRGNPAGASGNAR